VTPECLVSWRVFGATAVNKCRLLQLLPFSKSLSGFQHYSEEFPYLYRQDRSYYDIKRGRHTAVFISTLYQGLGRHQPSASAIRVITSKYAVKSFVCTNRNRKGCWPDTSEMRELSSWFWRIKHHSGILVRLAYLSP